jgi:hypothetical protein
MDMYREKDVLYLLAEETTYEPEKDKTSGKYCIVIVSRYLQRS